ncbi:PREDICTED: LEAF RUST 10 DISEASE-RESISTANCE LOCUS RECEPTOR-LIKE PROTEIN KINASE-like 1.2 isoform X2 [Ipomoea nil]|uniref:LEAF RUST 10 DISEASE-RESISTANCE LOCUS RECEPTOR-LIKE PROTEIN KINASE-like 1.2 isoform X2 n=1 Tax=Ipomoea nil TaxID=35883 RepID=UPI000900C225|nr:PREDICTED: LEAF RUST 10 DISEASE-RESISTANCE LOCUS RECEPTOR-LIKE PROTEIN KINASE-like 1.2 isoform X2 [Ipomoea nil]
MNQEYIVSLHLCIFSFVLLAAKSYSVAAADLQYEACESKKCAHGPEIKYPFFLQGQHESYCGFPEFNISCDGQGYPILRIPENDYVVDNISYDNNSFRVYNSAVSGMEAGCLPDIKNLTVTNGSLSVWLRLGTESRINILRNCSESIVERLWRYKVGCNDWGLVLFEGSGNLKSALQDCKENVLAPVEIREDDITDRSGVVNYDLLLKRGFELRWNVSSCKECAESGGRCGFNATTLHFLCFCPDRPHAARCKPEPVADGTPKSKKKLILIAVFGAIILILASTLVVVFVLCRLKKGGWGSSRFFRRSTSTSSDLSLKRDLEQESKYLGVPIFSYSELEEATNNFDPSKELGDGGFGTVYYGKLRDGREVAVKRLYEHNNKRMEQFRNEIEILASLRHRSLVTLYGYTSRHSHKLLLVYEYIPNGTVADHLHGERATDGSLTWPIRMNIAVEAASALAYLHASGIIHRDVKTTNILLDENFCVKVADFGLSRQCPSNATHVSTAPQGTPGYVDPEYHEFYQLTDKSDVYSFGVVLIELISSMPAVDITRHRHEINLSNLAMNRIVRRAFDELIDPCLGFETDTEIMRMTTCVAELAFRCLQHEKDMRPTMDEVLETLKEIQGCGVKSNVERETSNNNNVSGSVQVPPSPESEDAILLKGIRLAVSPISVTDKWVSSSTSTSNSG